MHFSHGTKNSFQGEFLEFKSAIEIVYSEDKLIFNARRPNYFSST